MERGGVLGGGGGLKPPFAAHRHEDRGRPLVRSPLGRRCVACTAGARARCLRTQTSLPSLASLCLHQLDPTRRVLERGIRGRRRRGRPARRRCAADGPRAPRRHGRAPRHRHRPRRRRAAEPAAAHAQCRHGECVGDVRPLRGQVARAAAPRVPRAQDGDAGPERGRERAQPVRAPCAAAEGGDCVTSRRTRAAELERAWASIARCVPVRGRLRTLVRADSHVMPIGALDACRVLDWLSDPLSAARASESGPARRAG